jgi:hypothetical protein
MAGEEVADIEDIEEILVFLRDWVRGRIERELFPIKVDAKIEENREIEVWITNPIFNVRDILMLKSLEKLFKIDYYEFRPNNKPNLEYLLLVMKPKKSAIKFAKKMLNIGGI